MNSACPDFWSSVCGVAPGSNWLSIQRCQSSAERATTRMRMLACERPQNSVHCPQYSPGLSAAMRNGWTRLGTASRLPFNRGIQNEWMTSRLVMESSTGLPAGMTISLAVTMAWPSGFL